MIKLVSIPKEHYSDYRYEVIFNAYKWDPQVEDINTVANQVVVISEDVAQELEHLTEQLSLETMAMEEALLSHPELYTKLGLPKKIQKALKYAKNYRREDHVRLMRFDFHPTETGWAVSEVNSDVPGGLAEASILPKMAARYFNNYKPGIDVAECLAKAYQEKLKQSDTVAFVHATSYSDDRQVMQFMNDYFNQLGFNSILTGPDHIQWEHHLAKCVLEGFEGPVDGLIRFFPLEWLNNLNKKTKWPGYYNTLTPSCNHPISILTQSKRLPLVWDELGIDVPYWKQMLPETKDPKAISKTEEGWIYKPALGRVGEGISIKGVVPKKEIEKIEKAAHRFPKDWLAQRMFKSQPVPSDNGKAYHLCLGVFAVQGKAAGFYGRISTYPKIDAGALDIPILVERGNKK